MFKSVVYLFNWNGLCLLCCLMSLSCSLESAHDLSQVSHDSSESSAVFHDSSVEQILIKDHSKQELELKAQHIQHIVQSVLQNCEAFSLWGCSSWQNLYKVLAQDLRQVNMQGTHTELYAQLWIELALVQLRQEITLSQSIGAELLTVISQRLRFRKLPNPDSLRQEVLNILEVTQEPLQRSKLIQILSLLSPLGQGEIFYTYTQSHEAIEVQVSAWTVIAKRHSPQETVPFKKLKEAMKQVTSLSVKAALIRAAIPLKNAKVINWCDKEWWRTELYQPCRDAFYVLNTERASYELWRWVKHLFIEYDQTISADSIIAEALTYLSPSIRSRRSKRRYQQLLDQYFSRRRAEKASILVAQSWLKLPSNRYALEISLRYFRPKTAKIVSQSHFFEQALKNIIYQLSNPLNIDSNQVPKD